MKKSARNFCVLLGISAATIAAADEVRMSHTISDEVVFGFGQFCPAAGTSGPVEAVSYWRAFNLHDLGIDRDLSLTRIDFGVETMRLPTISEVDIVVNLYTAPEGTQPQTGLTLLDSVVATVGELSGEVVGMHVDTLVARGTSLIVEVRVPSLRDLAGGEFGDAFVPGANGFGQTEPVYITSDACGISEPEPWNPDWGTFNYVLSVFGAPFCSTDLDGDGLLTVFDFLTFQNYFDAGDPRADLDGDGAFTIFDFLAFQNDFSLGCG